MRGCRDRPATNSVVFIDVVRRRCALRSAARPWWSSADRVTRLTWRDPPSTSAKRSSTERASTGMRVLVSATPSSPRSRWSGTASRSTSSRVVRPGNAISGSLATCARRRGVTAHDEPVLDLLERSSRSLDQFVRTSRGISRSTPTASAPMEDSFRGLLPQSRLPACPSCGSASGTCARRHLRPRGAPRTPHPRSQGHPTTPVRDEPRRELEGRKCQNRLYSASAR